VAAWTVFASLQRILDVLPAVDGEMTCVQLQPLLPFAPSQMPDATGAFKWEGLMLVPKTTVFVSPGLVEKLWTANPSESCGKLGLTGTRLLVMDAHAEPFHSKRPFSIVEIR
jgi:hypothetical protein